MSTGTPLELAGDDEPTLDKNSNTTFFPSFIDFLKTTDAQLAASRTKANISSNGGKSSSNSPTASINTSTSSACVEKETHDNKAAELAKDGKTMSCDFSSPGFVASVENKDMMDALNFTHAVRNTDGASTNTTADELSATTKVEAADSHKGIMNDEKERKHKKRKIHTLKRVLVSQDKLSRKWRAYFWYDKLRQRTFETQEECHLFHEILCKKLAQPESYNDKESIDKLVAHIKETVLYDKTKNMKRKREAKGEEITSLSDSFSSSLKSSNELNLNVKTFKDEGTNHNDEKRAKKVQIIPKRTRIRRRCTYDRVKNVQIIKTTRRGNRNPSPFGNTKMAVPEEVLPELCRRIGANGTHERLKLINEFVKDHPMTSIRQVTIKFDEVVTRDLPACISPPAKRSGLGHDFYLKPMHYYMLPEPERPDEWEKHMFEDEIRAKQQSKLNAQLVNLKESKIRALIDDAKFMSESKSSQIADNDSISYATFNHVTYDSVEGEERPLKKKKSKLAEYDESMLDTGASSSFLDFLESKYVPLAASQTITDRSCNGVGSSQKSSSRATNSFIPTDTFQKIIDPTTTINTTTPNTCVEGEMRNDRAVELAKDTEMMPDNYSTPGHISSLKNKDATNTFNFTHADTSTIIATDELSADAKAEIAYANKYLSDSIKNNKGLKHKKRKIHTLKRLLVSQDKNSRKWRACFFYDKFRLATFETQEDGYLFHKILRKKLAQPEAYNGKESIDELVAHIKEMMLYDKTKKTKRKREEEEETTSLSDNFSSLNHILEDEIRAKQQSKLNAQLVNFKESKIN